MLTAPEDRIRRLVGWELDLPEHFSVEPGDVFLMAADGVDEMARDERGHRRWHVAPWRGYRTGRIDRLTEALPEPDARQVAGYRWLDARRRQRAALEALSTDALWALPTLGDEPRPPAKLEEMGLATPVLRVTVAADGSWMRFVVSARVHDWEARLASGGPRMLAEAAIERAKDVWAGAAW